MVKACCWSITINNPTDDDNIAWAGLKDLKWVKEVKGQLEQGENGTPHIQGLLKTESVRFAQVKKALPRAHIEPAKNVKALEKYVQKEDTRLGSIPTAKVATQSDVQKGMLKLTLADFVKYNANKEINRDNLYEWLNHHAQVNRNYAECMFDASVRQLILAGYFGIEFVASNPQVRSAFKKYFVEIVIREYATRSELCERNGQSPVEHQQDASSQGDEEESPCQGYDGKQDCPHC